MMDKRVYTSTEWAVSVRNQAAKRTTVNVISWACLALNTASAQNVAITMRALLEKSITFTTIKY